MRYAVNKDIEILEEALDLETASRQMELAQMGYNAAVETEANKTREMHELKPASWWAQTFNTDGELRRREEGTKISMSLNTAKRQKETFATWQQALSPAAEKFKNGAYQKIIKELKKSYHSVKGKSASAVRSEALLGDLDERNALIWAYSSKAQLKEYKQLQTAGGSVSAQLLENTKKMQSMQKPSIFAQVFNTKSNKAFVKQRESFMTERTALKDKYQQIKDKREPLRQGAHEYVLYAAPIVAALEMKHLDIKKKNEQLYAPAPLSMFDGVETIAGTTASSLASSMGSGLSPTSTGVTKKKTGAELWGIAPKSNSSYNQTIYSQYDPGHPFALDDSLKITTPKKLV